MKKGGGSCLKILGCAGDPAEHEDLEPLEGKASLSRRKWSFRKRSDRRQLLSNDVVTEHPPLTVNAKEKNPEVDAKCYTHPADPPPLPAKIPVVKFVEETSVIPPDILDPEVFDTLPISKSKFDGSDSHIDEYDVIATQTVIRGYLARKELQKHKNIVKLQAVVRGHLVRRQAVGTLRCVQAIVKMQTLVRARRHIRRKADKEGMGKDISNIKQYELNSSTEKLLANGFARLLLEKSPSKKSKVIHISCDPSKSDSSWKWLERWMTVTSSDVTPQHQERLDPSTILSEIQTEEQGTQCERIETDAVITKNLQIVSASLPMKEERNKDNKIEADSLSLDSCADLGESKVPDLNEFQGPLSCSEGFGSLVINEQEVANMDITNATCDSNLKQICVESDTKLHLEPPNERHTVDLDKSRRTTKRMGEPRENESTNIGFGLRVVSGIQAVSAVQSKFDELNANLKSGNMSSRSNQESKEVRKPEIITQSDCSTKPMFKFADYFDQGTAEEQKSGILAPRSDGSLSHKMQIQTLGSECGTEISISSTLDSPDRSEVDDSGEIILEIGSLEKRDYSTDLVGHCVSEILHQEPKSVETDVRDHGDHISAIANSENVKQTLYDQSQSKPDVPAKLEKATDQQAHKSSSPEGSPRSHITAPESHETPASQISSDAKRTPENQAPISSSPQGFPLPHITEPESQGTPASQVSSNSNTKTEKCTASGSLSSKKRTTKLAGKNYPANKNMVTGVLSTPEHLPKNPTTKTSKRRNSLGSSKTEHDGDLEPRVSSSNSIPSYMQVTESAWAKVHAAASNSPKASPDGHGKESSYAKKRLSLPMGNGKPTSSVSPRIQPNSKADETRSPHTSAESRKWQR